ncbi:MAG TPA: amino acid-binding protein [Phycisphaerae bacterium]|nr:amino acid-binding protein [Phycisphaerae bacterium]
MLNATRIPIWTVDCPDQPGGLASKLEPLVRAGADLEFLLGRSLEVEPAKGVVFLGPLSVEAQIVAERYGFRESHSIHVVRLHGANEPGLAYRIARSLAAEQINVRAFSAMAIRNEFMCYIACDTQADAEKAVQILNAPF